MESIPKSAGARLAHSAPMPQLAALTEAAQLTEQLETKVAEVAPDVERSDAQILLMGVSFLRDLLRSIADDDLTIGTVERLRNRGETMFGLLEGKLRQKRAAAW